jgi:putative endonuclease
VSIKSDPATWTDKRHLTGLRGEEQARQFLESCGWQILAHRFRMGRLEIDLVARKGFLVSFIEVKTRHGRSFGSPIEAITWTKKREIVRVARAWMDRYGQPADIYRFDVIGVTLLKRGTCRLQHVEDAFRPGWR